MSPCYYLCCKHYQPLYPQVRLLYERVPLHRKPFVQVIVSESLQFMEIYYFHNGQ